MSVKRDLVLAAVVLLLGLVLTDWWAKSAELRIRDAQEAYDPELQDLGEGRFQILARRLRSERAIRDSLAEQNAGMAQDLHRARIQSVTTITVQAPPETLQTVRVDTVRGRPGIRRHELDFPSGLRVWVLSDATVIEDAGAQLPDVDVLNVISRRRDGTWWADVQVNPPHEVGEVRVQVLDPGPTWWERHDLAIGVGLGVAITAGLVYLLRPQ